MRSLWRSDAHPIVVRVALKAGELLFAAIVAFALFALIFITLSFGD